MAISATFVADFTSFSAAVDAAEVKLRSFEDSSGKVEGALSRMTNGLSGTKLIQDATLMAEAIDRVGGVSTLTDTELRRVSASATEAAEKMTRMGLDVPPGIQKIADAAKNITPSVNEARLGAKELQDALLLAFDHPIYAIRDLTKAIGTDLVAAFGASTIEAGVAGAALAGALVIAGKELYNLTIAAAATGESIYDASLKMSVTVPAVSQLKFAVEAAGGSLAQTSALIFTMQERMQQNPAQFTAGLKQLHLSLKDIADLSPDERFLALSTALRASGDETNRQAVAMDLFGRQGRDGLSLLLQPLDDLVQKGKDLGFTWTEIDAKAAVDLSEQTRILDAEFNKLKTDIGVGLLPVLRELVEVFPRLGQNLLKGADDGTAFDIVWAGAKENLSQWGVVLDAVLGRTADVPKVTGPAIQSVNEWNKAIEARASSALSITIDRENSAIKDATETYRQQVEARKKAEADLAKLQAEHDSAAMSSLNSTISSMKTLEAARAKAYDTGTQIAMLYSLDQAEQALSKSVYAGINSEKDRMRIIEDSGKRHLEILDQIIAKEEQLTASIAKNMLAELQAQNAIFAAKGMGPGGQQTLEDYNNPQAAFDRQISNLRATAGPGQDTRAQEADLYRKLQDALNGTTTAAAGLTKAHDAASTAATGLAANQGHTGASALSTGDALVRATAGAYSLVQGFAQAVTVLGAAENNFNKDLVARYGASGFLGYGSPGRAAGGSVTGGMSYMVGERGPELFTPSGSGSIAANGSGGVTVYLTVQGSVTTERALIDVVAEGLMAKLRASGVRMGPN